ncbi:MAG: hypothetical protein JNK58_07060 [Phycisphaerae bacterium]|nr:hypothetical protein [Phycisphaerae bacterium]
MSRGRFITGCGAGAISLVAALGAVGSAWGRPTGSGFDGKTFSQVNLTAPAQDAAITMSGARAWVWREGNTERVLLDRDVRVSIGAYSFRAGKATVWLEPIRLDGRDAEQVAVYFDRVSDPSGAVGLSQQADRLLVTAVIYRVEPGLRADVMKAERPSDTFVLEGEARLARFLDEMVNPPQADGVERGSGRRGGRGSALPAWMTADDRGALPPAERSPVLEARGGVVNFFADTVEVVGGGEGGERSVLLTGGVSVQHLPAESGATVQLSAERAVVFLAPGADANGSTFGVNDVGGVYLEGDVVATTGRYTLRGTRIFYDVRTDRAVVLDAVFWTYDEARGMPLYLRADAIRQESQKQWTANHVRMANVGFAEPHFSIGATKVTITNTPRAAEVSAGGGSGGGGRGDRTMVDAQGVTLRFGETPVMYLPGFRGEAKPGILRSVSLDSEQGDPILRTAWDLYAIAGVDSSAGNQATLLLDGYFNRGPAGGVDLEWAETGVRGNAFAYGIYDSGTDQLPSGSEINHEDEFRGVVEAEQVWSLSSNWTLFLEGSYISDETFIPAFFRSEAETRREYTNSAYLRYLDESTLFSVEARGSFNDFVTNQYLLQSLGYATEKFPEASYSIVGEDFFDGLLSYSSDTSLSAMRLNFTEPTVDELGFRTPTKAQAAFGLDPNDSIADSLRAAGLHEDETYRADTRHEVEMPLRWGAVNIVPFVSGRATAWDDNFEEFSGQASNESYRLWYAGGVRFNTSIVAVDDAVDSEFLDLHRMRHIVEPSMTVWSGGANLSQNDLPIYDDDVEGIGTGTAVRTGVRNTLQTQRGGADRWRSVDWLVVNTNYVWSSADADIESPYGRFIEAQPEQSNLGKFLANDAVLLLTDSVSLTNDLVYDFENQSLGRITAGAIIDHGFGFSTLAEYRYLDQPRATLVDLGARYEFTRKYAATLAGTIDADRNEFQEISARLERRFPQWTVDFRVSVDNITNDVSLGVALRPVGFGGEDRTHIFTRNPANTDERPLLAPDRQRLDWGPFKER